MRILGTALGCSRAVGPIIRRNLDVVDFVDRIVLYRTTASLFRRLVQAASYMFATIRSDSHVTGTKILVYFLPSNRSILSR